MTTIKSLNITKVVFALSLLLFGAMATVQNAEATRCYVQNIKKVRIGPHGGRHVYVWHRRWCR